MTGELTDEAADWDTGPAWDTGPVEPIAMAPAERLVSLDFIRGIAVMGILAANIVAFGQPWSAYMFPDSFLSPHGKADEWLWIAQFLLVDGKMRGLFSLLFGAGMMLFMEKAWSRGATRWLQARRLAFLLGFGLFHFFFIWRGDILSLYALCGFVALAFLGLEAGTQLKLGLFGYLAGAVLFAAMMVPPYFVAETAYGQSPALAEIAKALEEGKQLAFTDDATEAALVGKGAYGALVTHNFTRHGFDPVGSFLMFALETVPLMLIGMGLYRLGLFDGRLAEAARQRRWSWVGLAVGGVLTLAIALWVRAAGFGYYATLAAFLGISPIPRLLMVLGLAGLLAQWAPYATGWLGERVKAAGRAAFTNYLGTSILMLFVFNGIGLGLFGELTRPGLYVVTVLAWIAMLAWSKPWLDRYRYGPLEWLWRCLTYGRLFALRR